MPKINKRTCTTIPHLRVLAVKVGVLKKKSAALAIPPSVCKHVWPMFEHTWGQIILKI